MPGSTSKHQLPYSSGSDLASTIDNSMQSLAEALAGKMAADDQGTLASRPTSSPGTPGVIGRYFYATDTRQLFRDFGTGWEEIALRKLSFYAKSGVAQNQIFGQQTDPGVELDTISATHQFSGAPVEVRWWTWAKQGNSQNQGAEVFLEPKLDGGLIPGHASGDLRWETPTLGWSDSQRFYAHGLFRFTPTPGSHRLSINAWNPGGFNWWSYRRTITVQEL